MKKRSNMSSESVNETITKARNTSAVSVLPAEENHIAPLPNVMAVNIDAALPPNANIMSLL